ncbi:hypothetical protein [Flagellimonas aequoris]|uniref:Uncharacterized protein n=1 Tax=Flagellimonas aequoris TaxID=2306997 RepID=A0A418NA29_9FLAO|nr:hypothetical protein [Allomuricauda aequoris]RIV72908.1 hypothetical protein D2U88_04570 [Allomuricauda aequoris]TXK05415.1 hypothetical protein FQ019_04545 [Allomuricauda aequoris]
MAEIVRKRTIRPSTRKATSFNYRVDVAKVLADDILLVEVGHESKDFKKTYTFNGSDLANKNNISFRVRDYGTHIDVQWSGAQPSKSSTR